MGQAPMADEILKFTFTEELCIALYKGKLLKLISGSFISSMQSTTHVVHPLLCKNLLDLFIEF